MKSIVIAAPRSGSGKTTVTIGLLAALVRRGLAVAPFKVGPDFIDPGYHRLVTGRTSINLDGWICPEGGVAQAFARYSHGADVALVEGVMGLFDGIGPVSNEGSTAQVAGILGAPVVLVVDAAGQARSVAALVRGFARFDPRVHVAGVIFNNVASESHAALLSEAVTGAAPEIRVLGAIPRDEGLRIPSRHLGLVTAEENPLSEAFVAHLAEVVERHVDVEGLLNAGTIPRGCPKQGRPRRAAPTENHVRIAVARDAAFCFVYEENLRLLREAGAELIAFSPLADGALPPDIAGIYLPGGYPELFAPQLAGNGAMKEAIRAAVEAGMPVYAECGGFIYLTQGLRGQTLTFDNNVECQGLTPLAGVFPVTTLMLPRRKALGYREVEFAAATILGPAGTVARGHEFHYSEMGAMPPEVERVYRVRKAGQDLGMEGFRYRNCLASYVHLHFGSNPAVAAAFVASCLKFKKET